ncbi:MAG TPA: TlpA disulfide reductase family protein [Candidatus Limnocylindrales bacterium]|nr:TlpA disulfide reductase family protein [Candidatus Limnocylindrales bacterium]
MAAALATFALVQLRAAMDRANSSPGPSDDGGGLIARDKPAPLIAGMTLDGAPFSLADLRGHPVIVNFWGPSCVPCRDEFPLFISKLAEHQADGLQIVGVLMYDAPAPARDFMREYNATWPTVDDPGGAIRTSYRVAARPQSYFIDRAGVLRSIQVGELTDAEFERQYALISGPSGAIPDDLGTLPPSPTPIVEIPPP